VGSFQKTDSLASVVTLILGRCGYGLRKIDENGKLFTDGKLKGFLANELILAKL
jgi:hypothetical protein